MNSIKSIATARSVTRLPVAGALLALTVLAWSPAINAAPITMTGIGAGSVGSQAHVGNGNTDSDRLALNASLPITTTKTATEGQSVSNTTFDWQSSANSASFNTTMDHTRDAPFGSFARSLVSFLFFTVDVDSTYSLSGFYNTFGTGRSKFSARLFDSTGVVLFGQSEDIRSATDQSYVLGTDVNRVRTGNLTGSLIAGHDYRLGIDIFTVTETIPGTAASAAGTATGEINLTIQALTSSDATAIPEPGTLALLGLGLAGLGLARRRRKI